MVGGLGARVAVTPFERMGNMEDRLPYLAMEAMFASWRVGRLDAPGTVGATIGVQRWGGEHSPFGDISVGMMTARDGTSLGLRGRCGGLRGILDRQVFRKDTRCIESVFPY